MKWVKIFKRLKYSNITMRQKKEFIQKYKIKLLGIKRKKAIDRFFLELSSFLKFSEKNKIGLFNNEKT